MFKWFLLFQVFITLTAYSQECEQLIQKKCLSPQFAKYKMHQASRNYKIYTGETIKSQFEVVAGMDYIVSVCSDSLANDKIIFQVLTSNDDIIFDNSKENFVSFFEFTVIESQTIHLKINTINTQPNNDLTCRYCMGIFIGFQVTPKLGF